MPTSFDSFPLLPIDECPDVMADACVADAQGELIFLSAWARDTAMQQFLARLTLGRAEDGLDPFHLITASGASLPLFVGNIHRLEKRSARVYRRTLFGSLSHVWLFDRRCIKPDKANASALAVLSSTATDVDARLWRMVREACPLPLLDHWRMPVLALLREHEMLSQLPLALGPVQGFQLAMDVPALTQALGDAIRAGGLAVGPTSAPVPQDELVAG